MLAEAWTSILLAAFVTIMIINQLQSFWGQKGGERGAKRGDFLGLWGTKMG